MGSESPTFQHVLEQLLGESAAETTNPQVGHWETEIPSLAPPLHRQWTFKTKPPQSYKQSTPASQSARAEVTTSPVQIGKGASAEACIALSHLEVEQVAALELLSRLSGHRFDNALRESALKEVFRTLAKRFHPDKNLHLHSLERQKAARLFADIREAYTTLRMAFKRAQAPRQAA